MFQLPCPHCGKILELAASRAGSEIECSACHQLVSVPKLGHLRQRQAEQQQPSSDLRPTGAIGPAAADTMLWTRLGFVASIGVVAIALGLAGFCLVRYLVIEVPETTESHLQQIDEFYSQVSAAQLVEQWRQLETFREDTAGPYAYQRVAQQKARWAMRATSGLVVALIALALALGLVAFTRRGAAQQT